MLKWSLSLDFKRPFWEAFSTAVDTPDDEGRMAMEILFKPWVKAMEQMVQNCMDISQSKNQRVWNAIAVLCQPV